MGQGSEQVTPPIYPPLVALDFACPTCKAKGGEPCVTKDGEPTEPHAKRGPAGAPELAE